MPGLVELRDGRVRGQLHEGVWRFAGLPYGASTAASGRWRPARPPEAWTGILEARDFGPVAPQTPPRGGLTLPEEPTAQSEDCLTLNIWTPALDDGRRPVMVWIHGGSFLSGSGSGFLFRGAELAEVGDVVVVTLNYRLGALGFLGHRALAAPDEHPGQALGRPGAPLVGNWGLHDQVAALRWVREHISAFGGDPGNVTVFGESAGAMSLCALLAAPAAVRLFHRAVVQSGPPYTHSLERASGAAQSLVELLGLPEVDRAALERVPAADLVRAAQTLADRRPEPGELPLPFLPVVDGSFLPRPPQEAIAQGQAAHVALLAGTTRDEMTLFTSNSGEWGTLDEERLLQHIAALVPDLPPEEVVATYRRVRAGRGQPTGSTDLWNAIGSDAVFRWPTLRLADAQSRHQPATFVYLFTWPTPFLGGRLGACHGVDLPFVFGAVRFPAVAAFVGGGPGAERLVELVERAWSSFARAGDPSTPLGEWPPWDPDRRPTMLLGPESVAVEDPDGEELRCWSEPPGGRSRPGSSPGAAPSSR